MQLNSCLLICMKDGKGIPNTLEECGDISKSAGGIGVSVDNIRSIVPMLNLFYENASFVDGGGKRKGTYQHILCYY